jgi:hypothetical protein
MTLVMPAGWDTSELNRWLHYHGESTKAMTAQRTALESKLIPITAYVCISAVECYRRHPEMVAVIDAAMPAEEIGARARYPGNQVDSVHIWSQANIYLLGRNLMSMLGQQTPDASPERTAIVLDFWKRVSLAFRGDGNHQAFESNLVCTPYHDEVIREIVDGTHPIDDTAVWSSIKKTNAQLHSYQFLLYFDTRSGMVDTGPYDLGDGRVVLLRDYSKMGPSDFWWSTDVAAAIPYQNLTAAYVLRDVEVDVNDWGTSVTRPENYLDHVERFGMFTTDNGQLETVPFERIADIHAATKDAQRKLYRHIAAMTRDERIAAGAYVYFSFLRPFAEVAGCADELDWTCPRDSSDVYPMLSMIEGGGGSGGPVSEGPYYLPFPS